MKSKLIALLVFFNICLFAGNPNRTKDAEDSLVCLEISGRLLNIKGAEDNQYKVELICNGKIVDSLVLNHRKEFKLLLKKNSVYGIRINKKGFVSRLISVDTNLPQFANGFFRFQFDTELIDQKSSEKLDKDALDFPIAIISFNPEMKCFYYSEEYTTSIKRQLYLGEKNF